MKKFTFKTEKATGRYRSFESDTHHIKYNKIECGYIGDKPPYKIRLQVMKKPEDPQGACPWKWIILKQESKTLQEAKDHLQNMLPKILELFTLYLEN